MTSTSRSLPCARSRSIPAATLTQVEGLLACFQPAGLRPGKQLQPLQDPDSRVDRIQRPRPMVHPRTASRPRLAKGELMATTERRNLKRDWLAILVIVFEIAIILTAGALVYAMLESK